MCPFFFNLEDWHRGQTSRMTMVYCGPPLDGDAFVVNQSTASLAQHYMECTTLFCGRRRSTMVKGGRGRPYESATDGRGLWGWPTAIGRCGVLAGFKAAGTG